MTDFKIPDTPDTDSIWDRVGNEWQRKVYNTKKVWMCIQTGVLRSWVGLLRDFGPLTDTPPVPKVGDILTDKTAYVLPPGSIALADNSVAILKRNGMFYGNATRLSSWEDLHKYVKYEPIRVVRVGWCS